MDNIRHLETNIEVDLSEERMKKAWQAYRERWIREEENRRNLERQNAKA